MTAVVFSMTGFSLLVSAFARTREQVIPLGLTVIMVFCALGGCWWPLYQMPPWLRQVAQLTFTTWAMEGFHDVILRDRGILDILPGVGVLVAYGALCLAGWRLVSSPRFRVDPGPDRLFRDRRLPGWNQRVSL